MSTTTGGAGGATVEVSTLSDLNTNAGTTARILEIGGTIAGDVTIGSNKTLVGLCGAEIHGHIQMTGSVNVVIRNLTVVGDHCTDYPSDRSAGADAITVENNAHHPLVHYDDISDGSDGNLDITHASDFITVSWTRFHYSGRRTDPAGAAGGHQFSNLFGHSDSNASEDTGHLTVTFHHDWWADNVVERMPRVRFGRVHLFDNLDTAAGNDYCIGVGVNADIRDENNVFIGVKNPIDSQDYSNAASVIASAGNAYQATTGTTQDLGDGVHAAVCVHARPDLRRRGRREERGGPAMSRGGRARHEPRGERDPGRPVVLEGRVTAWMSTCSVRRSPRTSRPPSPRRTDSSASRAARRYAAWATA